jgi:adenosylcobinamide-phosphate synthase
MADHGLVLGGALVLDALMGDPPWLWRRLPHPVVLMGRLVGSLESRLNGAELAARRRRRRGVVMLAVVMLAAVLIGMLVHRLLPANALGAGLEMLIVAVFLAQRSLYEHVRAVAREFDGGIAAARQAVARIVGRDPAALDRDAICRAALESLAENFADGVVAPVFWYLVAGLPGLLACKALNTADSMVGYRNVRYMDFGYASARLDDLANWLPARLAGGLLVLAAFATGRNGAAAWRAMLADAGKHRSPNAGWPEAAMAGALGLALAGPRPYDGAVVEDHWMHAAGRKSAGPEDIAAGLRLFAAACALQLAALAPLWF